MNKRIGNVGKSAREDDVCTAELRSRGDAKRVVLVVCLGTSPAVLTETVWALAHQATPIVPDEVVVLVTKSGKEKLCEELLSGKDSVWNQLIHALERDKVDLRGKLVFGETLIRVIPDESGNGIWDLRSGDDNLRAADFMLRQIRQYTESADSVVLASIAGGRKTMSALLFSCMSLLGREEDKVYHVLLPQEFEGGVTPTMYFPKKGVTYTNKVTGKRYKGDKFKSELFEVPFVRMRGWYQEKFNTIPPSYRTLVSKVQGIAPRAVSYPDVCIDLEKGVLMLGRKECHLGLNEFAALVLFANGISAPYDIYERLFLLHGQHHVEKVDWIERFKNSVKFSESIQSTREGFDPKLAVQDVAKTASQLRKCLTREGLETAEMLVPQRGRPVTFPIERIQWKGRSSIEKSCGYLFDAKNPIAR